MLVSCYTNEARKLIHNHPFQSSLKHFVLEQEKAEHQSEWQHQVLFSSLIVFVRTQNARELLSVSPALGPIPFPSQMKYERLKDLNLLQILYPSSVYNTECMYYFSFGFKQMKTCQT